MPGDHGRAGNTVRCCLEQCCNMPLNLAWFKQGLRSCSMTRLDFGTGEASVGLTQRKNVRFFHNMELEFWNFEGIKEWIINYEESPKNGLLMIQIK